MKIIEREKTIKETCYVAFDETEFETAQACEEYETEMLQKQARKEIENLKLNITTPPISTGYVNDEHEYVWYRVNNEEDVKKIARAYNDVSLSDIKPTMYPSAICIENDCSYYGYTLEECRRITEAFWKQFDIALEFQEKEANS